MSFPRARLVDWNGPLVSILSLGLAFGAGLLLIYLPPLDGVLLVGLGILGVATLIEPRIGMVCALFLGLWRAYLQTEVPLVPAQIAQFFVALALAAWVARGLARRELRIRDSPVLLPLLAFLGAAILSQWDAAGLSEYGLPELIKWGQILLVLLFVHDTLTYRHLPWLLGILLVIGLFQAGLGIWQFGIRGYGPSHFAINDRFYRAYGTFEQPNPYAGYIGIVLSLAIGLGIGALEALLKGTPSVPSSAGDGNVWFSRRPVAAAFLVFTVLLLAAIILGVALGMSWSRGAWLGLGGAVLMMTMASPRKTRRGVLLVTILLAGGLVALATGLLPDSIADRLTSFTDYVRFEDVRAVGINPANFAVVERLAHWQAALQMLRSNPYTGVGFGGYESAYPEFALINWPIPLGHAHNYYLNIAAETGIIGLIAYLSLTGVIFWQTWRATRTTQCYLRGLAIGLLGVWTHLSVHHFLDNLYVNNVHLHIAVLLGLLAFVTQEGTNQRFRAINL